MTLTLGWGSMEHSLILMIQHHLEQPQPKTALGCAIQNFILSVDLKCRSQKLTSVFFPGQTFKSYPGKTFERTYKENVFFCRIPSLVLIPSKQVRYKVDCLPLCPISEIRWAIQLMAVGSSSHLTLGKKANKHISQNSKPLLAKIHFYWQGCYYDTKHDSTDIFF